MTSATDDHGASDKSSISVFITEMKCVLSTAALLVRRRIALRPEHVGLQIRFADGSRSTVYRESAMRPRSYEGLVLIVVRFRLRLIGHNRLAHWLFRVESMLNTLLFAAHPGFETKLWLTDLETGFYRGIYEWRGRREAIEYAETLKVVLRPWSTADSFCYHVIEGVSRTEYLQGSAAPQFTVDEDSWWQTGASTPLQARSDERR